MGNKIVWICLGFATGIMVRIIVKYFIDRNSAEEEYSDEAVERINKSVAEYRTYIVNQWICLLAFWCGISADDAKTKLTTPGANFNGLYFFTSYNFKNFIFK